MGTLLAPYGGGGSTLSEVRARRRPIECQAVYARAREDGNDPTVKLNMMKSYARAREDGKLNTKG